MSGGKGGRGERGGEMLQVVRCTYYEEEAEAYSSDLSMISFCCLIPKMLPLFQLKGKHNPLHHQ